MIRWIDLIGVAGFAMVVLSTLLLFPDSAERMHWRYWLGGVALWCAGFASMVGWLLWRWSVRLFKDGPPPLLVWSVRQSQEREVASKMNGSHRRNEKAA
jgi:hypothetical protein